MAHFTRRSALILAAGVLACLPTLVALLPARACLAAAPQETTAVLDAARELVAAGQVAQAKDVLEKLAADFPTKPDAEEARGLVARIRSIEILVDFSHDFTGAAPALPAVLKEAGFGVTENHAYLPTLRAELVEHELVVLWQRETTVKYDDLEYAALHECIEAGGHLLLITTPDEWLRVNRATSTKAYPLAHLARRFGLKLKDEFEEVSIGKGKVFHYRNATLLVNERLRADAPTVRRDAVVPFQMALPYPKLEDSQSNRRVDPEITFKEGLVTFYYSQPLKRQADWAIRLLPGTLAFYRDLFGAELPYEITVYAAAGTTEPWWFRPPKVDLYLCVARDQLLHQQAVQLYKAWMQPAGATVEYPHWMETPWADMVALDFMKKLRLAERYENDNAYRLRRFREADRAGNVIDISVPPKAYDAAHSGKCRYVFQDLMKRHGYSLLRKFRAIVFLHHDAGRLPARLSTPETVRLLSLAAGKDLFGYFRATGMNVPPVQVDFSEPARLQKQIDERKTNENKSEANG